MKKTISGLMVCMMAILAHGDGDALFKQGTAVFKTDPAQAYSLFVQAAEEGNVSAMVGTGHCLENGIGTEVDYAGAILWYEKAVEQNNLKACEGLARIYASAFDPSVHNGEKAVKYAVVLVRKAPRDSDALVLLAAAHARNVDFERAGMALKKALKGETRAVEITRLEQLSARYERGMPSPAVAMQEWITDASNKGSMWALEQAIRKMSDPSDPLYDPEAALALCLKELEAGNYAMYVPMGSLYLDLGDFDKVYETYEMIRQKIQEGQWIGAVPVGMNLRGFLKQPGASAYAEAQKYKEWRKVISVSGKYDEVRVNSQNRRVIENGDLDYRASFASEEELKAAFPSWERGSDEIITSQYNKNFRLKVYISETAPDVKSAEFLLRVAAKKGFASARESLEAREEYMKHCRELLESEAGKDNGHEMATELSDAALDCCNEDHLPVNLYLLEDLYLKAYDLAPSSRTAYILGALYLRDYFNWQDVTTRSPDIAEYWLKIAHARGYRQATRRLIILYACDKDLSVRNAGLAIQYATAYAAGRPADDHDARQLLACAYAANNLFMDAKRTMAEAVELCPNSEQTLRQQYYRMQGSFNKNNAWASRQFDVPPHDAPAFPDWVKTLNE